MELLDGPAKKESWKRNKSDGEAKTEEGGTTTSGKAPAFVEGITEIISRVSTTDPRADISIERIVMAPTALMGIGVMEMTLVITPPAVPIIIVEEEVQVTRSTVSAVPRKPIIIEVVEEKEPIDISTGD